MPRFRLTCRRVGSARLMRVGRASSGLLNTENETESLSSASSSSSSSSDSSRCSSRRSSLISLAESEISVASPSPPISIPSNSASGHDSSDSNSDHSEVEIDNGENNHPDNSHNHEDNHSDSDSSSSGSEVSLPRRNTEDFVTRLLHIPSDSSDSDSSVSSCSSRSCSPRHSSGNIINIWSSDSEVEVENDNPDQGDNSVDGSFQSGHSSNSNISVGSVFPRPSPASSDSVLGRASPIMATARAPRRGRAPNQEVPQMPPTRGRGARTNSGNAIPNVEANEEANEGTGAVRRSTLFECCVCLEHLDQPASISVDEEEPNNNAPPPAENLPGPSGGGARRRGTKASASITTPHRVTPADTVATQCGHLYHQVCLEKWFNEQGRRTCPSCRKSIPKNKLTRLYPSLSGDTGPAPDFSIGVPANGGIVETGQGCTKQDCQDLKDIHSTLINDYSDLRTRYDNLHEEFDLKEAQLRSLEEDNTFKNNEIERLKRQLNDEIPAGSAAKRRRK